jgi:hypothetical protein
MRSPDGAARCAAVVTLGLALAWRGAAGAAETPEQAYVAYFRAVHDGNDAQVETFLGPQAQEQLRTLPPAGRLDAIRSLQVVGMTEPHVVRVEPEGNRVVLHLAATVDELPSTDPFRMSFRPGPVTGQVVLAPHGAAFIVDSERWTSADRTWEGLVAPGVFRADLVDPTPWAIADIRAVTSAESAYQSLNHGYYGPLSCLPDPGACVGKEGVPPMLKAELTSLEPRNGFQRRFDAGPEALAEHIGPGKAAPTSFASYAYWVIPVSPTAGLRAHCGDGSGLICEMSGAAAAAPTGACPPAAECTPVR